jgi:hypothetical protein
MAWLGSMGKLWHCARLTAPGGAHGPAYRVITVAFSGRRSRLGLAVFAGIGW